MPEARRRDVPPGDKPVGLPGNSVRGLVQPAAMGVLLREGWHIYNEAVTRGALCLLVCSVGIILGFIASLVLTKRQDKRPPLMTAIMLFWISCMLNGGLMLLLQIAGLGRSNVINVFLSSSLLGATLAHIVPKVTQQIERQEPEVWMPAVFSALLAETICLRGHKAQVLQAVVPTFLVAAGVHGCMITSRHSFTTMSTMWRWIVPMPAEAPIANLQKAAETAETDHCTPEVASPGSENSKSATDEPRDRNPSKTATGSGKREDARNEGMLSTGNRGEYAASKAHSATAARPATAAKSKAELRARMQRLQEVTAVLQEDAATKGEGVELPPSPLKEGEQHSGSGTKLSRTAQAFVPSYLSIDSNSLQGQSSLRADAEEWIPSGVANAAVDTASGVQQWDINAHPARFSDDIGSVDDFAHESTAWESFSSFNPGDVEHISQRAKLKVTAKAFVPSFEAVDADAWEATCYPYGEQTGNGAVPYNPGIDANTALSGAPSCVPELAPCYFEGMDVSNAYAFDGAPASDGVSCY